MDMKGINVQGHKNNDVKNSIKNIMVSLISLPITIHNLQTFTQTGLIKLELSDQFIHNKCKHSMVNIAM